MFPEMLSIFWIFLLFIFKTTGTGGCPGSLTEVGWHGCFVYSP